MKKIYFVFVISIICLVIYSFINLAVSQYQNNSASREIVLRFVTYNGYGNNLFIDNVLTGTQTDNDITVTSFLNIPYDTVYSVNLSGTDTVSPIVTVSNIGRSATVDSVKVYFSIEPGGYIDSSIITGMLSGQTSQVEFRSFIYTIGTGYFLKSYVSYNLDSNQFNDTLRQYTISLPGFERNVLYEEFTSNSSFACLNNNSYLNTFLNRNPEKVTGIIYHTGLLGLDSFYLQNQIQNTARSNYYFISAVPTTFADGRIFVSTPYGDSSNLYTPFFTRLNLGTPVRLTVTDENISEDSVKATVNIEVISDLPGNNYVLKINAVQRFAQSDSVGTNGETQFYDIFRAVYPDTNGIQIPSGTGNYQYQYTYFKEPYWIDSLIYTSVFIQNNNNREIMNSAKSRIFKTNNIPVKTKTISGKSDLLNVNYNFNSGTVNPESGSIDTIQTKLNIELFESFFPPLGWKVLNQDGFITFNQFAGANGPTIGGNKSVIMKFFDYNIPGQRDTMYSKRYRDLLAIDTVRFDWAYAQYNSLGVFIDSLEVSLSTDGGLTFPVEVFRRGGFDLSTAPITTSFFIPQNSTQWRSYKFSLGGIVSINNNYENTPVKYLLDQNFPNPFNPVTVISYTIPVSGNVSLKIYDLLGKEITTLVNEVQNPGTYKINFNASTAAGGLSSGIYFYRLSTDGFSDVKRMVLVK